MDTKSTANALIHDCELKILGLMESCLSARQYEDVGYLAALASALSKLTGNNVSSENLPLVSVVPLRPQSKIEEGAISEKAPGSPPKETMAGSHRGAKSGVLKYPFFERQSDRLIKVGWSKKERAAYEHRVPREVVLSAAVTMLASMSERGSIRMDAILPLQDGYKAEIPSYQAYLVLAWLRHLGVVIRQGNDGYALGQSHTAQTDIESLWDQTPERRNG